MKTLSIIIVNYNSGQFLHNCLDSLEIIPSDWEIIIVANGSREKLKVKNEKLKVTVMRNENNEGFAKANNQAIKKSTGEFILLLNPDTLVSQKAMQSVLNYLKRNSKTAVATCKVVLASGKLDDAAHRGFPTPWRA